MANETKPLYRFRLLAGGHEDNGPDGKPRYFRQGDIVETHADLTLKNGGGSMQPKFERLNDDYRPQVAPRVAAVESDEKLYEAMTLEELKALAAEEEVDIKGAKTKDEIIKVLKKTLK